MRAHAPKAAGWPVAGRCAKALEKVTAEGRLLSLGPPRSAACRLCGFVGRLRPGARQPLADLCLFGPLKIILALAEAFGGFFP